MKKLNIQLIIVTLLVGLIFACKGPAGETGPQGDSGAQGATGAAGAPGAKGEKGDGGANITTTPWVVVKNASWNKYTEDTTFFDVEFLDKVITQSVLDKGAIFAYAKPPSSTPLVLPLPYVSGFDQVTFLPIVDAKEGGLMYFSLSGFSVKNDWAFRWVIIQDLAVRNGKLKNINWKNYEEVKVALDLKD